MRLILIICIITLSGCMRYTTKNDFFGSISTIPKSAKFSGWTLNHCDGGKPIKLEELECAQIGGEIYVLNIAFPRNTENQLIGNLNQILIVQHGLLVERNNINKWCFDVKPAPINLVEATRVKYIAMNYKRNCDSAKLNDKN